jgi:hypothetical protein
MSTDFGRDRVEWILAAQNTEWLTFVNAVMDLSGALIYG